MAGYGFDLKPKIVPKIRTKYRIIKTRLPVPESIEMFNKLDKYESISMHGQLPVVWDKADGFQVYDAWGNKWIDFTSTIFVANAGHGNRQIISALKAILKKPLLHTYTYANEPRIKFIEYLIKNTPKQFEKVFLLSAGTEATEAALKLIRMYGFKNGKKKPGIICFEGNWHGRTLGAQMMSHNPKQKEWIGYHDPNIYHLPFPYPWCDAAIKNPKKFFIDSINQLLKEKQISAKNDICGIVLETFQGWGAVFYPKEYVQEIKKFANENNILIAFDEMQAGFGRTGKLFGYMHYDIEPDIIACGKGSSSSVPLSFVMARREIMDLPEVGSMSSTHSANPMSCAAGKANLQAIIENKLIENSQVLGEIFHNQLNKLKEQFPNHIRHVLGKGLVAALIFIDQNAKPLSEFCSRVCEKAMHKGLLVVHTGRESIKLAPPLSINKEALLEGLSVLEDSLKEVIVENKND